MKSSATLFPIALALGAITLAPWASTQAQGPREEEGPIEIEKCQTISQPGAYKLVNNLTSTGQPGTCLNITASFVTIDLAGFTVTGPHIETVIPPGTTAISAGNDMTGITVRNGSISSFAVGVSLEGDGSNVEGLRVTGQGSTSLLGIAASGIVKGNTVVTIGASDGVFSVGIIATGIVTGNYVSFIHGGGFAIGEGSTVIGNTATNGSHAGAGFGFSVDCPANVTDNTAVNNDVNLVLNGNGCNNTNNVAP
jgi:hypothetical protein